MLSTLEGGCLANLKASSAPSSHLEMFREVVKELAPHCKVKLDERRFREVIINGPGWTHTAHGTQKKFAIRVTKGSATFRNTMDKYDLRVTLYPGNWLYVPACSVFMMTTGAERSH